MSALGRQTVESQPVSTNAAASTITVSARADHSRASFRAHEPASAIDIVFMFPQTIIPTSNLFVAVLDGAVVSQSPLRVASW
jgi:hypothetical protein